MTARKTSRSSKAAKASKDDTLPEAQGSAPVDNASGYELPKDQQVNLAQLAHEIETIASVAPGSVSLSISEQEDGTQDIWIVPSGTPAPVVAEAVADHEPDPNWGISQTVQDFPALVAQLQQNEDMPLTGDALSTLVRGLALQWGAQHPRP